MIIHPNLIKLFGNVVVRQLVVGIWLQTVYFNIEGFEKVPADELIARNH